MKKDLLRLPIWNYKDLMQFLGCKKTKAYEVIAIVKKHFNGETSFSSSYVKRDSVLNYLGTSIEREIYIDEQIKRKGVNK